MEMEVNAEAIKVAHRLGEDQEGGRVRQMVVKCSQSLGCAWFVEIVWRASKLCA